MTINEHSFPCDEQGVFAVLIDPDTYPRWLVGAKNIREVAPGWPAPGSHFRHVVGFGPLRIPDRTTVLAVEAPSFLQLKVRARPVIEAVVTFEIVADADGCRLKMTESPLGLYKTVAPVMQPLVKARNARSLKLLADVIAQRSSSAPA